MMIVTTVSCDSSADSLPVFHAIEMAWMTRWRIMHSSLSSWTRSDRVFL